MIKKTSILTIYLFVTTITAILDPISIFPLSIFGFKLSIFRLLVCLLISVSILALPRTIRLLVLLKNPAYISVLIWLSFCLLSNLWSQDLEASIKQSLILITLIVLLTIAGLLEIVRKSDLVIGIIFILSIIMAIIEQLTGFRFDASRQWDFRWELTSFYINPAHLGCSLALMFPFVLNISINSKKKIVGILWISMMILMLFVILRTGSKGAILTIILEIFIILVLSLKKIKFRKERIYLFLSILLILITSTLYLFKTDILPEIIKDKIKQLTYIYRYSDMITQYSYRSRLSVWEAGIDFAKEYPISGWGIGLSDKLMNIYSYERFTVSMHNIWIQTILEVGIIGVVLLFAAYLLTLIKLIGSRVDRKDMSFSPHFVGLLGFLPVSVTVGSLYTFYLFWILWGFSIAYIQRTKINTVCRMFDLKYC